ncbi:Protein CBG17038 [Caenorhabditis briggsae]|uniref:Cullin-1 n=1 Tax=Caenorhabditis briggsae TaxID=6238 RepID=A8XQB5_CAEBR|nr:Protein CBG17038 [Caenorhabditis briggsae]CAP34853.2 Protein CBG17038 [Caenorhabditis briggsae]
MKIEDTWMKLELGLNSIFKHQELGAREYLDYYKICFDFCTDLNVINTISEFHDYGGGDIATARGKMLYDRVKSYIVRVVCDLLYGCVDLSGEPLLQYYSTKWELFSFAMKVVDGIFAYLNRHWVRREFDEGREGSYMVYTLGLVAWREALFEKIKDKLRDALLELVRIERTGGMINRNLISTTLRSLEEIGHDKTEPAKAGSAAPKTLSVYRSAFETPFLETTRVFYTQEVQDFLQTHTCQLVENCKEYMEKFERRLREEELRVELCLNRSTMGPLKDVCEEIIVTKQLGFIQSHFGTLLVEQADDDIGRMYQLCLRVEKGLEALRQALQDYVTKVGREALEQRCQEALQDPKIYVHTILEVHQRYQGLVERSFSKEVGFVKSLDTAAIAFINRNAVTEKAPETRVLKSPELIARYCDLLMKKNSKMPDEMEMDVLQKNVITIFKYLEDKDIFMKFYTKHFSKRLLNEQSASDEAESSFISKLTECCGFEYTSRLAKMVQDTQVSKDLSSGFKDQQLESSRSKKSIEFGIQVLSTGTWPSMMLVNLNLPRDLSTTVEGFTAFYNTKFTGRKLSWIYNQSRGEITSTAFKGKKYVFGATTTQMCTLLLFNEQLEYSAEKIQEATGLDTKTTQMVLGSLVKNQVLKIKGAEDVKDADKVSMNADLVLNMGYSNKKVRVDLSKMTMAVQTAKDQESVQKSMEEDRKNIIQAAIVRIMKTRKQCSHQKLMVELIEQLSTRFKPKVELIKKCIGSLIEKEYLKRNEDQRDLYDYLA